TTSEPNRCRHRRADVFGEVLSLSKGGCLSPPTRTPPGNSDCQFTVTERRLPIADGMSAKPIPGSTGEPGPFVCRPRKDWADGRCDDRFAEEPLPAAPAAVDEPGVRAAGAGRGREQL